MRPTQLVALLCFVIAALALPSAASAQESGPGIRIAPAFRWPTRAPFGTTIRCPYSYVPDGDTVGCWGDYAVGLVMIEGPRCGGVCRSVSYYGYGYWRRGCYGGGTRYAYLRGA